MIPFRSVVLIAEASSAKRHSLILHTEETFSFYGARSRAPTTIRRPNVNHLHQRKKDARRRHFVGGAIHSIPEPNDVSSISESFTVFVPSL